MTKDINTDTKSPSDEFKTVAPDGENGLETDSSLVASKEAPDIDVESNVVSPEGVAALPSKDPAETTPTVPKVVNYTAKGLDKQNATRKLILFVVVLIEPS